MESLKQLGSLNGTALYQINGPSPLSRYISTSPQTRSICNDPFVLGVDYTNKLQAGMTAMLEQMKEHKQIDVSEKNAVVLNILRGGLNFGLREALADAFDWNLHGSAFLSSQRAQDKSGHWHITENRYEKISVPKKADLIVGDVVATGVSLEHALNRIIEAAIEQKTSIRSLTFVTIGGKRAEEIIETIDATCKKSFEDFIGSSVIYIEGRFSVAEENDQRLKIAIGGTDLLRRDSLLAPEFIDSQSEGQPFALERCTIYDAGSRAFQITEYLADVHDYWTQVKALAQTGTTYATYLEERFPEDARLQDKAWVGEHNSTEELASLADGQIKKATE
ncbi:MAG: hypothetical protein COW24_00200 [Candidatus Kerfeldbacteria bacterium CG15_BIG_FIL_POST_REV_8_21_14_020_45_12]|uniref:Phosphoribosyltransferase domain-containing protein n=1 Tax=Candidatus Kerfeldbacteria bacterium CG15_BIG_FIL_POST_REV_8_21_14_020_45_12 TaxID=2014247 RepID=A0A2M7H5B8_9BACT|nr:MAG: hypothetical protein COW24_00200 [Candidatus Kerfeldbacteria bacterium CG15_BIG_FIL_POST_REV_8_21_14_020_45_12]PJA93512.1 MAG: hypothetical protein CO132_02680 [Candidatus Kerfeldbacteria bacterium CG_4_9_14_3_um_filter_45_8]